MFLSATIKRTILCLSLFFMPVTSMAQYVNAQSPTNGATDVSIPVAFQWSGSGCEYYWLQVDDDPAFGSPEVNSNHIVAFSYNWTGASSSSTYYWHVNGHVYTPTGGYWVGFTSTRSFTTECPTPDPPTLSTPADDAVDVTRPVYFDWSDVASIYRYEIQIDDNSDFSSITEDYYETNSEHTSYSMAQGTEYFWRVRADFNNGCGWGNWGTVFSFTVECPIPDIPTLTIPDNDATGLVQSILLDWSDVSIANTYRVMADDDPYFGSPELDYTGISSEYSVGGLNGSTTYYWKVMAMNACGNNGWSEIRRFTTACADAGAPTLLSPADGATNLPRPITFDWDDMTDAVNYNIQIDATGSFTTPLYDDITNPISEYIFDSFLGMGQTYYWRVRTRTNGCSWSGWSSPRSFTHACAAPLTAVQLEPANGAIDVDQPFLIDWSDAANADVYHLNVDDDPAFGSPEVDVSISSEISFYFIIGLSESTTYYWRVLAEETNCGQGLYSDTWSFTTSGASGMCGDVNLDAVVNILDIVYMINYKYKSGPDPCNPPVPPLSDK